MGILLWLDDERPAPVGWAWAKNLQEAIKLLETGEVTHCSLDYDLGLGMDTGYDVACYIAEQAKLGKLSKIRCYVHSHSEDGKRRIKEVLRTAYKTWAAGQEARNDH